MAYHFSYLRAPVEKLIRRAASEILLPCFRHLTPEQIRYKNARDVVTDVDEQAEHFLSEELVKLIKNSVVVGEENCFKNPDCMTALVENEWTWLVDPIDGTNNFIKQCDEFGIMVGLVHNGIPYAGWIFLPIYDIFICGSTDNGVLRNGIPIGLTPTYPKSAEQLRGLYRQRDKDITDRIKAFPLRNDTHCNAFDFSILISGDSDFIVYPGSNPWDIVAGSVLIQTLGGYAAKANGEKLEQHILQTSSPFLATRSISDWKSVARVLFPDGGH
jgi:fructose-1,6-bisphosphatase/inositol monophosphatase family enzyme